MLSIVALVSAWLLIHTLFAFHYARRYCAPDKRKQVHSGGSNFPGNREPDYLDFVYYSFVVGMTSQVSDVAVISRSMRRLTTVHRVLAFFFNIVILAMNMNIIASILSCAKRIFIGAREICRGAAGCIADCAVPCSARSAPRNSCL